MESIWNWASRLRRGLQVAHRGRPGRAAPKPWAASAVRRAAARLIRSRLARVHRSGRHRHLFARAEHQLALRCHLHSHMGVQLARKWCIGGRRLALEHMVQPTGWPRRCTPVRFQRRRPGRHHRPAVSVRTFRRWRIGRGARVDGPAGHRVGGRRVPGRRRRCLPERPEHAVVDARIGPRLARYRTDQVTVGLLVEGAHRPSLDVGEGDRTYQQLAGWPRRVTGGKPCRPPASPTVPKSLLVVLQRSAGVAHCRRRLRAGAVDGVVVREAGFPHRNRPRRSASAAG